jgi:hypothetical protein
MRRMRDTWAKKRFYEKAQNWAFWYGGHVLDLRKLMRGETMSKIFKIVQSCEIQKAFREYLRCGKFQRFD